MLKSFFRFLALTSAIAGLGTAIVMGAANAAPPTGDVPLCSRTVTDKCMEGGAATVSHQAHRTAHAGHHTRHHADRHAGGTSAAKATEHKG